VIVLGLDTTGADCSACVVRGDTVLAHISEPIGRGHAERLAPMVVEVLAAANILPDAIDRIAVCTGPGSFTGLRVALSFAKGFALPRKIPVLGFDALSIKAAGTTGPVTVYRDVKRGQVFAARYADPHMTVIPMAMTLDAAKTLAGADLLIEAVSADVRILAKMAISANPADHPADPLYARAPDAKLPGGITPPVEPA